MTALKVVTVRLPEELHRLVKVRLAERGDSFEGVARAAFVAYLERGENDPGSLLERAGVSVRGLGAGEVARADVEPTVRHPRGDSAAASSAPSSFRPDPKVKR